MIRVLVGTVLSLVLGVGALVILAADDDAGTPNSATGEQLFQAKGCVACHTSDTIVSTTNIGPNLDGLATRAGFRVAGLSAEEYVRQSITDPTAFVVDGYQPEMPALALTGQELDALVGYLLNS